MEYANISARCKELFRKAEEARDEHSRILSRLREEAGKYPVNYQQLAVLQSKMENRFLALIDAWEEYYEQSFLREDCEHGVMAGAGVL